MLFPPLGVVGAHDVEPEPCRSTNMGGLYGGTRALEEFVHGPAALVLHVLEHVSVAPEGHRRVGVALSPICPDSRPRSGVNRGIKSPAHPRKPFIYGPGPSRKPDSLL